MADELLTIEASKREENGKTAARKIRARGNIPANLVGKGQSESLEIDPKLLSKAWKSGKKFNLTYNGETKPVEMKEVQIHSVKRTPLHVDLMYC